MANRRKKKALFWTGCLGLLLIFFLAFTLPSFFQATYSAASQTDESNSSGYEPEPELVIHPDTPEPLKAIYMTSCVAGTPSWRTQLKTLIEKTELNAVIIDVKDYTGTISYNTQNTGKGCVVSDLREFVNALHQSNIYVIGRISVFQDLYYSNLHPELAVRSLSSGGVWQDRKGLSFIDVGAKPYWDYIVDISNQAYALGFDELNYDYVRYPSDGNMDDANFTWMTASSTKAQTLESFFSYLHNKMKDTGAKTSVDIFGMTTSMKNDMGIGQVLEKTLPYFDHVSPMVYPSHYPNGWNGFAN